MTTNASSQSTSKNALIGRIKMPTEEEFKNMIYDLLIYLQEQNDVILYATEETLKKELELLYKECEWRYENGKQGF